MEMDLNSRTHDRNPEVTSSSMVICCPLESTAGVILNAVNIEAIAIKMESEAICRPGHILPVGTVSEEH